MISLIRLVFDDHNRSNYIDAVNLYECFYVNIWICKVLAQFFFLSILISNFDWQRSLSGWDFLKVLVRVLLLVF